MVDVHVPATMDNSRSAHPDRTYFDLRPIPRTNRFFLAFGALLLAMVFNINSGDGLIYYAAVALAVTVILSICIIPLRLIAIPVAVLIVLMPDLTQTVDQIDLVGRLIAASVWQLQFGPLTPAMLVLIFLLIALLRISLASTIQLHWVTFFYFFGAAILLSFLNGYPQESVSRFITDFKIPVFVYTSLLLFDAHFRKFPEDLLRTTQVFMMFLVGALVYQVIIVTAFAPSDIIGRSYVHSSLDSAKGLTLAVTFFALAKVGKASRIVFWFLILCVTLSLLITYQTRWLLVTLFMGLLLVFFVYPLKKKLILALWFIPIFLVGIVTFVFLESEALEIMLRRFSFVQQLGSGVSFRDIEVVRTASILNSVQHVWDNNALLTGMGYGSWYDDDFVPMPNLTTAAFDQESLSLRRFYRVHDFGFHFLFKFGVLGLLIYLSLFLRPLRGLWSVRRAAMRNDGGAELFVVLFGIAPTVITYMWFTGKGNLFCGFYIALCSAWLSRINKTKAIS